MLQEFPFDHERKRMSVVVRRRNDKQILLLSKGADHVMLPRMVDLSPMELEKADDQMYDFAKQGFRVLVIAKKYIDESAYHRWVQQYEQVNLSFQDNKQQRLYELFDEFE